LKESAIKEIHINPYADEIVDEVEERSKDFGDSSSENKEMEASPPHPDSIEASPARPDSSLDKTITSTSSYGQ
jgi:hypothetical protein